MKRKHLKVLMLKKFICKGDRAMKWINEPQCNSNEERLGGGPSPSSCKKRMESCRVFCIILFS